VTGIYTHCDHLIVIHDYLHSEGRGAMIWRARRPDNFVAEMNVDWPPDSDTFGEQPLAPSDYRLDMHIYNAHHAEMVQVLRAEDLGDAVRRYWGEAQAEWATQPAIGPEPKEIHRG
jgi:hypothetical protein